MSGNEYKKIYNKFKSNNPFLSNYSAIIYNAGKSGLEKEILISTGALISLFNILKIQKNNYHELDLIRDLILTDLKNSENKEPKDYWGLSRGELLLVTFKNNADEVLNTVQDTYVVHVLNRILEIIKKKIELDISHNFDRHLTLDLISILDPQNIFKNKNLAPKHVIERLLSIYVELYSKTMAGAYFTTQIYTLRNYSLNLLDILDENKININETDQSTLKLKIYKALVNNFINSKNDLEISLKVLNNPENHKSTLNELLNEKLKK